jgi:hypothetical protein
MRWQNVWVLGRQSGFDWGTAHSWRDYPTRYGIELLL